MLILHVTELKTKWYKFEIIGLTDGGQHISTNRYTHARCPSPYYTILLSRSFRVLLTQQRMSQSISLFYSQCTSRAWLHGGAMLVSSTSNTASGMRPSEVKRRAPPRVLVDGLGADRPGYWRHREHVEV